jgi:hypothetical protein
VNNAEVVVEAAVRLEDGSIVTGRRHADCIRKAKCWVSQSAQGFLTNRGRFVDRREGKSLMVAAGWRSVAEGGYRGDYLYSEDLY